MKLLNLFFQRKEEDIRSDVNLKRILIIRTDERLGEIILTLPLINHLRKACRDAGITFLMCSRYRELSRYIDCDDFIFFEKRDIAGLVGFLKNLRSVSYDMVVIGGKISPPSLTSYLLLGVSKGRLKVAIKQNDFNPFVNVRVSVETISEPFSKYELATKITGLNLPFDNSLRFESKEEIKYDVMIFVDARKTDHLIPSEKISDILNSLCNDGYSILVVSGRESSQRISELNINPGSGVEFAYSPPLDELIRLIKQSKSVIVANTGIMHLSVALGTPTCGIFVNANPYVWGYQMNPHLMIDAREKGIDINQVVNFVRCSITKF